MTTQSEANATTIQAVLAREEQRCQAISNQRWEELESLLTDDLTHVHMLGRQEDKAAYLAGVRNNPRTVTRKDLQVRVYADTAVITGAMTNTREGREDHARVTQVWVRKDGQWYQAAFQASRNA
mgnify:CR=1 FL=1